MRLDYARLTLARLETVAALVSDLEGELLENAYGAPPVICDIAADLRRLRDWAEAIVWAREQEALAETQIHNASFDRPAASAGTVGGVVGERP